MGAASISRGHQLLLERFVLVRREIVLKLVQRLKEDLAFYETIIERFKRKYGCELADLEERIEREGVPTDAEGHRIWEDSIEWRNAAEEAERVRELLSELEEALERSHERLAEHLRAR